MEAWELPILLVAPKKYLEALQNGYVYMKNCMYYQRIEEDAQRGDLYDSAIPSNMIHIPDLINGRIIMPYAYIKCFFHYKPKDIRLISNNRFELCIPDNSITTLKEMSQSTDGYALLIYDTTTFIKRFVKKCDEFNQKYYFDDVDYIDNEQYDVYEQKIINAVQTEKENAPNPIFIKRNKYQAQQEFRIAVIKEDTANKQSLDDEQLIRLTESDTTIEIAPLNDISVIVKLQDIIDNPCIIEIGAL